MHVVHVVRQFHPAVGGFESVCLELASAQVAAGHTVRVVTLNRLFKTAGGQNLPDRDQIGGIEIVRIPFVGSPRYPIAPSVLRHLAGADIVHVHAIDFFFDFLAWTKPIHRKKLVVSTHGGFFHTSFAARLKRLYFNVVTRLSMIWYDGVAAVSIADQGLFASIRKHGIVCIENGANTRKYAHASSPAPTKSIIWIGRFSHNKRVDRLIRFMAALRQRDPEWSLQLIGRAWDLGADDLRTLAEAEGIGSAIHVADSPADSDICRMIGSCSVIASSSDYEGFGVAVVEGMAAGLFPLVSGIPPFERLVSRSRIGLIVDFDDADAAAEKFLTAWNDVAGDYSGYRGRAISAASAYDWLSASREYERLYEDVLGKRARTILDVPVLVKTQKEAVEFVDLKVASQQSTMVAFANAHALNVASVNPRYRHILQASVVVNDGIGIDTASRILFGAGFPQNLNGSDFTPSYLKSTRHMFRIFLLGGHPGVAEQAARRLSEMCPQHSIVGVRDGYFGRDEDATVVSEIRTSKADLLLVAMGIPLQEFWLADNLEKTGCRLGLGVGALFDFLAGKFPRAPSWLRSIRFEWVYRFALEPRRLFRRYIVGNPLFLARVLAQWWSGARV
jgi:alpha-1,3-mannosyltransferase